MKYIFLFVVLLFNVSVLAQNIGIGTTMPAGELHVTKPSSAPIVTFNGNGLDDMSASSVAYTGTVATNIVISRPSKTHF
jgi:hypothetical protein